MPRDRKREKQTSAAGRQAGDYEAPVLTEPMGGPVPKWSGGPKPAKKVAAAESSDGADSQPEQPDGHSAAVQAAWLAALAALLAEWPSLAVPLVDALAAAAGAATAGGGVSGLGALAAPVEAVDQIGEVLRGAMFGLADDAARQVVADAARQGVDIDPPAADRVQLSAVAQVTAELVGSGYANAATRTALAAGPDAEQQVRDTLTDMGTAEKGWVADNLGAALTTAQNAGRAAVFEAHPPRALRANETLDKNTCSACTKAANREYPTLAAAHEDYNPGGGLRACEGRGRCRGYLVPIWA